MNTDCNCDCKGYSVTVTENGYATTITGSIVTSTATASACSDISYEDAWLQASSIAKTNANIVAKNDANIIDQTIIIIQNSGLEGPTGATGPAGSIPVIGEGYGSILVNTPGTPYVYYNTDINVTYNNIDIQSNLIPRQDNKYTLGNSDLRWKEIYMGPGTLNIKGPEGGEDATLGSDKSGIAYTEKGFATPFVNIGPAELTPSAVGGWKIRPQGLQSDPNYDLVAQEINPITGDPVGLAYSIIKNEPGATGPAGTNGIQGATGPTGPQGTNGIQGATGPTGPQGTNGIQGATGPTGPSGLNGTSYNTNATISFINVDGGSPLFLSGSLITVTTTTSNARILLLCQLEYAIDHNIFQIAATIGQSITPNLTLSNWTNAANNVSFATTEIAISNTTGNYANLATSLSTQSNTQKDHGGFLHFYHIDTLTTAGTYYYIIRLRGNATTGVDILHIYNCSLSVLNI